MKVASLEAVYERKSKHIRTSILLSFLGDEQDEYQSHEKYISLLKLDNVQNMFL